jgi:hypothetical protein
MTLKQALALRLPNGTPLGDASPEELEAEARRIASNIAKLPALLGADKTP